MLILGLFVATVVGTTEWKKSELSKGTKIPPAPNSQIDTNYFVRKPAWSDPTSTNFSYTPSGQTVPISISGTSTCQVYTYERIGSGPEKKPELKTMFIDYLQGYSHRYPSTGTVCVDPDQVAGKNETKKCLDSYNRCLDSSGTEYETGDGVSYPISCVTSLCQGKVGSISLNFKKDDNNFMTSDTVCLSIDEIKMRSETYDAEKSRLEFYNNLGIISIDDSLEKLDPLPIKFSSQVCNPLDPKQKLKIDRYSSTGTENTEGRLLKITFRALPEYYLDMDFTGNNSIDTFSVSSLGTCYSTGEYIVVNNQGDNGLIYIDNDNAIADDGETVRLDNVTIINGGSNFVKDNSYGVSHPDKSLDDSTTARMNITSVNQGSSKIVLRKSTTDEIGNKWLYMPVLDLSPEIERIPAEQRVSYAKFVPIAAEVTAEQLEPPKSSTDEWAQDVGGVFYDLANPPGDSLERKAAQINASRSNQILPSMPVKLGDRVTPTIFGFDTSISGFPSIVSRPTSYPNFVMNAKLVNGSGNITPYNFVNYGVCPAQNESFANFTFTKDSTSLRIGDVAKNLDLDIDWNLTDPFSGVVTFPENYYTKTAGSVASFSPTSGNQNINLLTNYMSPTPNTLVLGSALQMSSTPPLKVKNPPVSSLPGVSVTVKGSGFGAKFSLIYSTNFFLVPVEGGKNFETGDILSLDPADINNTGGLEFDSIPPGTELTYALLADDIDANKVVRFKPIDEGGLILRGAIIQDPKSSSLLFSGVDGTGLPEIESGGLGYSNNQTINIINVDKTQNLTVPDAKISVTEVTTSDYLVRQPAPVSLGKDVKMEYNFMSNSPMVLDPAPSQLVYAGATVQGGDSLTTILTDSNVDLTSNESFIRYISQNSLEGKTEITFLKTLQFSSLNYSTKEVRSPSTQEQPILGKYVPHSIMTSVTGSGSGLKWDKGDTYYNSNNFQFINYGSINPYKRNFSNSSNL
jgi:hypothetical protein